MNELINLTGKRFERLTVVNRSQNNKQGKARWDCLCDCGNYTTVSGTHLRKGRIRSCGCLRKENTARLKMSHGYSGTRLYDIWKGMKNRCHNPSHIRYHRYGGRGISVCEEWITSFENFKKWALSHGYQGNLTVDRINNDGNYEPSNCRWATEKEQAGNRGKAV